MKRGAAFALAALAISAGTGCSIIFDPDRGPGGSGNRDAGADIPDADPARPDASHRCADWGERRVFDPCDLPEPNGEVALGGMGVWTFDTGTRSLMYLGMDDPGMPTVVTAEIDQRENNRRAVVISADRFDLGALATLRVVGPLPLIIASWSDLNVSGTINVSSHVNPGPGSNETDGRGGFATDTVSGGGGGGLGQPGGVGGSPGGTSGPSGGPAIAIGNQLRGGCSGGLGDDSGFSDQAVGDGGGAILLSAIANVAIGDALVTAGGEAGDGGQSPRGGAGGGSGGMIALEAPTVQILSAARIEALGGGGGGGGGQSAVLPDAGVATGEQGGRGNDGYEPVKIQAAGGASGIGLPAGGEGGNGSGNASAGNDGDDTNAGGGGGGGGPGYIVIWGTPTIISGSIIRPPATINPD